MAAYALAASNEDLGPALLGGRERVGLAVHPLVEPSRTARQEPLVGAQRFAYVDYDSRDGVLVRAGQRVELGPIARHAVLGPVAQDRRVRRRWLTAGLVCSQRRKAGRIAKWRHRSKDSLIGCPVEREYLLGHEEARSIHFD